VSDPSYYIAIGKEQRDVTCVLTRAEVIKLMLDFIHTEFGVSPGMFIRDGNKYIIFEQWFGAFAEYTEDTQGEAKPGDAELIAVVRRIKALLDK
jgi:hypothetical protein